MQNAPSQCEDYMQLWIVKMYIKIISYNKMHIL